MATPTTAQNLNKYWPDRFVQCDMSDCHSATWPKHTAPMIDNICGRNTKGKCAISIRCLVFTQLPESSLGSVNGAGNWSRRCLGKESRRGKQEEPTSSGSKSAPQSPLHVYHCSHNVFDKGTQYSVFGSVQTYTHRPLGRGEARLLRPVNTPVNPGPIDLGRNSKVYANFWTPNYMLSEQR